MPNFKSQTRIDTTDARAGYTTGRMRRVLFVSLALAIVAMSAAWIAGALSQDDVESQGTYEGRRDAIAERQAESQPNPNDGVPAPQ